MDLELFKLLSKYPFSFEGEFFDSIELPQNKTCSEKCKEKDCLRLNSEKINRTQHICSKGYNNLLLIVGKFKIILNGLIYHSNIIIPSGRKDSRKEWILREPEIQHFCNKIEEIERHLLKRENETTLKNFAVFHDFKTSMNIFFTCTQDIINNLTGASFEDKLEKSGKSYQDLYHSLGLITSQLRMIDIIINPTSIYLGNKKEINIFQLFDKMRTLFSHISEKKKSVNIHLSGYNRINNSICYDSIEFIPLILIDNALKYSARDSDVQIEIEQLSNRAKITVKNIGPFVSKGNEEKIFEKFFRDESAKIFTKEGIGMGLWIAQQILTVHQTKLFYYRDTNEHRPVGLNIFEFELATI